MKVVTSKQWADYLNQRNVYARESSISIMEHVFEGKVIGTVLYLHDGSRIYMIEEEAND